MPHALGKAAAEHTDAKHQAAHKHDPAGPLPVRNQAADNHRDKAQRIGDREHDGQTGNIQLLCHRRGQHAPGIHGPMHRLMRQQITKRTHRFLVNAAICSLVNFILFLSLSLVFGNKMALRYTMPMKPDFIFLWPFPGLF